MIELADVLIIVLVSIAIVALVAAVGLVVIGVIQFNRQLEPDREFTGDQGIDSEGRS